MIGTLRQELHICFRLESTGRIDWYYKHQIRRHLFISNLVTGKTSFIWILWFCSSIETRNQGLYYETPVSKNKARQSGKVIHSLGYRSYYSSKIKHPTSFGKVNGEVFVLDEGSHIVSNKWGEGGISLVTHIFSGRWKLLAGYL